MTGKSKATDGALDVVGLAAATAAVTAEIDRYWKDDTVEPGHGPVAAAAVRAYLAALPPPTGEPVAWMTDEQIQQWVDACNHEPAREALRHYLTLRSTIPCTCHPDDNPPRPCPKKYALSDCRSAAPPQVEPAEGETGE